MLFRSHNTLSSSLDSTCAVSHHYLLYAPVFLHVVCTCFVFSSVQVLLSAHHVTCIYIRFLTLVPQNIISFSCSSPRHLTLCERRCTHRTLADPALHVTASSLSPLSLITVYVLSLGWPEPTLDILSHSRQTFQRTAIPSLCFFCYSER